MADQGTTVLDLMLDHNKIPNPMLKRQNVSKKLIRKTQENHVFITD